nr:hypothetical protein [Tanacetum cinerariifolium]
LPAIVEPLRIELPFLEDQFQEDPPEDPPEVPLADNQTMAELLQAPTEAQIWLEKEPPRSIITWDDLVTKFINQFFPPSKTTNLRNEITRFQQRFVESFYEKNQSSAPAPSPTPAPFKAVELNCVTYGGTHSYQNCHATNGNVYRDNIQEYVSQAATANHNQGNTGFRP